MAISDSHIHRWPVTAPRPNPGWQCPGCGACFAPFVASCTHCLPSEPVPTVPPPHTTCSAQGPGTVE